ncbi:MAG TPA: RNA-binding protein [Firmicutes bacterium]|nr:RNA-binding protein [Bacillota bacterium]
MNIYVGNLAADVTDEDLKGAFEAFGRVDSAKVITDKYSGTSRGFGFVEMPDNSEAQAALDGLNGKDLKGKILIVNEARSRSDRGKERGGGGGGGGRGGGRSGGRPRGGRRY